MPGTEDSADFELVRVPSGALSLRSREFGETFHPGVGPIEEARNLHIAQQRLTERVAQCKSTFVIWDIGLGAAANAVAALEACASIDHSPSIEIHSFDISLAPLIFALQNTASLSYLSPHLAPIKELTASSESYLNGIRWKLRLGDFRTLVNDISIPPPHSIIYDPYSPQSNPGMWSLRHFTNLRARLASDRPCLMTSYSKSTAVRVTLLLAGFFVGKGSATGEKTETTVASNSLELLQDPLPQDWLSKVRRSTSAAPLGSASPGPISESDLKALQAHPQFR